MAPRVPSSFERTCSGNFRLSSGIRGCARPRSRCTPTCSRSTKAVCLREHAYIARTGWSDDAGCPRGDVRHPAQGPRSALARRVRRPARTRVDWPDDGPVRPRVAEPRESVRRPRAESQGFPGRAEVGSGEARANRRFVRPRGRPPRSRRDRRVGRASSSRDRPERDPGGKGATPPRNPRGAHGPRARRSADRLPTDSSRRHRPNRPAPDAAARPGGHGPGFTYPPRILESVKAGRTVGKAMERLTGIRGIGSKEGAIGYLTERRLDRDDLTESAVLMAMVPRIRRELYARGVPPR